MACMKPAKPFALRCACVAVLAAAFSSLALGPRTVRAVTLPAMVLASAAQMAVQAAPRVKR